MDFKNLTYQEAAQLVLGLTELDRETIAFSDGDHFQGGRGWVGPWPRDSAGNVSGDHVSEVGRHFVAENVTEEVIARHLNGVQGRPAQVRSDDEALTNKVIEWLSRQDNDAAIQNMFKSVLLTTRGVVRLYIPEDRFEEGTTTLDLEDPMELFDHLYLTFAPPDSATVHRDLKTQRDVGVYLYQEPDDSQARYAEVTYIDPDSKEVVLRRLSSTSENDSTPEYVTLKNLPIYEIERERFIGTQFLTQQKKLNLTQTMEQANVVLGGYTERILLNVGLKGNYITDSDGNETFVPDPVHMGAGVLNAFTGIPITDMDGNARVADPKVVFKDPVDTAVFRKTEDACYRSMLRAAHQLHHLIAGETEISSKSRESAMADHVTALLTTKKRGDYFFVWLAKVIVQHLAIVDESYEDSNLTMEVTLDVGPISPDMMLTVLQLWRDHLVTTETALTMIGVENVQMELSRLKTEVTQQNGYQRLMMLLADTMSGNMGGSQTSVPKDTTSNKSIKLPSTDPDDVPGISDPAPRVIR